MNNNENANHKNKDMKTEDQNRKTKEKEQETPKQLYSMLYSNPLGSESSFFCLNFILAAIEYHGINYVKHVPHLIIV